MSILISKQIPGSQPLLQCYGSVWRTIQPRMGKTHRECCEKNIEWSNWGRKSERQSWCNRNDGKRQKFIVFSLCFLGFFTLEHCVLHSNSLVGLNFKWSLLRIMNKAIKYCLNNLLLHGRTSIIATGKRTSSICIWVIDGQFTMFVFYFLGRNERALILLLAFVFL